MKAYCKQPIVLLLALFLAGNSIYAQRKPRIKGNRNPVSVSEALPPFNTIRLEDDLEVRIRQGATDGYELNVDDNLVDVLRFEVSDSTLVISSFYNITGSRALDIDVVFREIRGVEVQQGHLLADSDFTTDVFSVVAGEAARVSLRLRASLCNVDLTGNSRADLNIQSDSLALQMSDRTDAVLYADNQAMSVRLSGNADLTLDGISDRAELELTGETGIDASKMAAESLRAHMDQATTARIFANSSLGLDLSGQARVYLYGDPQVTLHRFADRAELHKVPD